MVLAWFEFRGDAEVGAEEAAPEFGDQFLTRPLGFVFSITAKVAIETLGRRCPVDVMPISA